MFAPFSGYTQIMEALKVQPEFRTRAEEMRQTQGRVSGYGPLAVQNAGDPVGRHVQLTGQAGGAHAEFVQFLGQMFPRMYRGRCHGVPLMIVDHLKARRSGAPSGKSRQILRWPSMRLPWSPLLRVLRDSRWGALTLPQCSPRPCNFVLSRIADELNADLAGCVGFIEVDGDGVGDLVHYFISSRFSWSGRSGGDLRYGRIMVI